MSVQRKAVINDLSITGERIKIISRGRLRVDNEVQGDVAGDEVIIGKGGKVTGTVAGERVIVVGKVIGAIHGKTVALQASAQVEGDIHHTSLIIEKGAEFRGRCRRPTNIAQFTSVSERGRGH